MPKICFLGAGSTVFAKNVLGDCIYTEEIKDLEIVLHDIDQERLQESENLIKNIVKGSLRKDITLSSEANRKEALRGADYVVNAIQVGGYDPCTITDFEVPKKYGLTQTIGDTLGIGGIFRALRTIPVMQAFAKDMEEVCPNALFINYTNPMAMLTGYMQRYTSIKTIGLCHSVQECVPKLLKAVEMEDAYKDKCKWEIAGINHQAWLLKITDLKGNDLYPEIKKRALVVENDTKQKDLVRLDIMDKFGYYTTESSEHASEYTPWYIKSKYPELIDQFNIPLDEYPRRCIHQRSNWKALHKELLANKQVVHDKTFEFASYIIKAMETDTPFRVHGNVLNTGLITNLPANACVEVPCLIDRNGVNPCYIGELPEQCAAINRTNINVQLLTVQAAVTLKKEDIYRAAMLDPHTASELSMGDIIKMCDELIKEHGDWLPNYQ